MLKCAVDIACVFAACLCVVQGGVSHIAAQTTQQANGFAPGQHPQTTCIPLLLATIHIAVVASTTRLSDLQLHSEQEKAHHMYLLCQQMRKKVGLLADVKVPQQSAFHFYSGVMQSTIMTVWFCTCKQVTLLSAYCIHFVRCRPRRAWPESRRFPDSYGKNSLQPSIR